MKTRMFSVALVVAVCCVTGCKSVSNYFYAEYRLAEPVHSVYAVPQIADLQVSETKINYAERINVKIKDLSPSEVEALAAREKETVISNAIKSNKADVLVA
ncbi:MAG: hypothetical protein J5808_03090, partial [Paludibacteraceae bacterium]|nr:hypothetical protein [Paludibacteraceae bacterium]